MDSRTKKNPHEAQKQVMKDLGFDDGHTRFDAWLTNMSTRAIWKDFDDDFLARRDISNKYKGLLINPVVARVKEELQNFREGCIKTTVLSSTQEDRKLWNKEDHYVYFCTQLVLANEKLFCGRGLPEGTICEMAFRVLRFFVLEAHPSRINASGIIKLLTGQNSLAHQNESYYFYPSPDVTRSSLEISRENSTSLHYDFRETSLTKLDGTGDEEKNFIANEHKSTLSREERVESASSTDGAESDDTWQTAKEYADWNNHEQARRYTEVNSSNSPYRVPNEDGGQQRNKPFSSHTASKPIRD